ncbi:hypothetical protein B0H19DRAFT_1376815 [Mycena capillaripes]|nr:hypothetical protein B0H19DRAFT_1376815 [Mycena capillaripes]
MDLIAGPFQATDSSWIGMLSETKDTLSKRTGTCDLCDCSTNHLTQHHLYPRAVARKAAKRGSPFTSKQKDSVAGLCWPCHCIVHRLIPADVLASSFHSIDLLKTHDGILAWLHWAQPKGIQYLHSIMISKIPRPPKNVQKAKPGKSVVSQPSAPMPKIPRPPKNVQKAKPGKSVVSQPSASASVLNALDTIWAQNQGGFPRWEGKGTKTRGHALRQRIRTLIGSSDVKKPDIRVAMSAKPEYQESQQWVFGPVVSGE